MKRDTARRDNRVATPLAASQFACALETVNRVNPDRREISTRNFNTFSCTQCPDHVGAQAFGAIIPNTLFQFVQQCLLGYTRTICTTIGSQSQFAYGSKLLATH